jgi:hypothetical protein
MSECGNLVRALARAIMRRCGLAKCVAVRGGLRRTLKSSGGVRVDVAALQGAGGGLQHGHRPEAAAARLRLESDGDAALAATGLFGDRGTIVWGEGRTYTSYGLRTDDVHGRSYAPRGRTPEMRVNHKRAGLGLTSVVTTRDEPHWRMLDAASAVTSSLRFLGCLVQDTDQKVFVILDRRPVHRFAKVRA